MAKMKVPGGHMVGVLPVNAAEKATENAPEKKTRKPKQDPAKPDATEA